MPSGKRARPAGSGMLQYRYDAKYLAAGRAFINCAYGRWLMVVAPINAAQFPGAEYRSAKAIDGISGR